MKVGDDVKLFNSRNFTDEDRKVFRERMLVNFAIAMLALFVFSTIFTSQLYLGKRNQIQSEQERLLATVQKSVNDEFLSYFSNAKTVAERVTDDQDSNGIVENWLELMKEDDRINNIALLNRNGFEKLRIYHNYGNIKVIDDQFLVSHHDQFYYLDARELKRGQQLVSQIELETNYGIVRYNNYTGEYTPIIRVTTPIFDENGISSFLVVTYNLTNLFEYVSLMDGDGDHRIIYVSHNGYMLNDINKDNNFGWMFEEKNDYTFSNFYIEEELFDDRFSTRVSKTGMYSREKVGLHSINTIANVVYSQDMVGHEDYFYCYYPITAENGVYLFWSPTNGISRYIIEHFILLVITYIVVRQVTLYLYITNREKNEYKEKAHYDEMSGALTRGAGLELIQDYVNNNKQFSLAFIDVNGLKNINDELGHDYGDTLIKVVCLSFDDLSRENDTIIRWGGDEFIIISEDSTEDDMVILLQRLNDKFEQINVSDRYKFFISVSYGIVNHQFYLKTHNAKNELFNIDEYIQKLIRVADNRMYTMKDKIKDSYFNSVKDLDERMQLRTKSISNVRLMKDESMIGALKYFTTVEVDAVTYTLFLAASIKVSDYNYIYIRDKVYRFTIDSIVKLGENNLVILTIDSEQ